MKKKIINGLLFAVALVTATSSFVSCKDYEGDNYNGLQQKYASLADAFRKQVSAPLDRNDTSYAPFMESYRISPDGISGCCSRSRNAHALWFKAPDHVASDRIACCSLLLPE